MITLLAAHEYIACDLSTTETVGRRPSVRGQMSPGRAPPSFYCSFYYYYYYSRTVLRFVWVGRLGETTAAADATAHNHWILCARFPPPYTVE